MARLQRARFQALLRRSRIASTAGRPIASAHFNRTRRNVKKAKGSELPGAEIALGATLITDEKAHRDVVTDPSPRKGKRSDRIRSDLLAKVLSAKNWLPAYLA